MMKTGRTGMPNSSSVSRLASNRRHEHLGQLAGAGHEEERRPRRDGMRNPFEYSGAVMTMGRPSLYVHCWRIGPAKAERRAATDPGLLILQICQQRSCRLEIGQ